MSRETTRTRAHTHLADCLLFSKSGEIWSETIPSMMLAPRHPPIRMIRPGRIANKLLGVRTIAEFVETAAIDTAVQQIGVDFRQGQLFQNAANLAAALDQLESSNHSWQTAR